MKKNIIKITNILFLLFILLHMQTTFSFAYDPTDLTGTNMPVNDTLKNVGNQVIGILQAIGIVVSVAVATILGIKYMLGSVDQSAGKGPQSGSAASDYLVAFPV